MKAEMEISTGRAMTKACAVLPSAAVHFPQGRFPAAFFADCADKADKVRLYGAALGGGAAESFCDQFASLASSSSTFSPPLTPFSGATASGAVFSRAPRFSRAGLVSREGMVSRDTLASDALNRAFFWLTSCFVFLACLLFALVQMQSVANAADRVTFDYTEKSLEFNLARKALLPEITAIENEIGRSVLVGVGKADLNGDDLPEIFAVLPETALFCDQGGACPVHIFSYDGMDLFKIGRFKTRDVKISLNKTKGIRDIETLENGENSKNPNDYTTYRWDGKTYSKQDVR